MELFEWIVSMGIITLIGLMFKNNYDNDKKIARIYQRLDQTKEYQEKHFTNKDVCQVLHTQIDAKLLEIATDVKYIIKNGVRGARGEKGERGERGERGKSYNN